MNQMIEKVKASQRLLKYAISAVLLLIGLDQVFRTDLIQNWDVYVNPLAASIVPAGVIILVLGLAEILVAILMATRWTVLAAYISAVVLVVTAINLLMLGYVDVAARDVLLIGGVLVLAWLTQALHKEGIAA
jgi:hypothetical protein